jgi:hypothetical protein
VEYLVYTIFAQYYLVYTIFLPCKK